MLAALLLDANRLVTIGHLTDVLWDATPPAAARAALHNQVRRLRDALGGAGRERVRTGPGGYLIRVEPGELDVMRMRAMLASARAAVRDGAWDRASATAAGAVLLWRGEPLAGLDSEVLARRVPELTEIYRQAVEIRMEAEVNLGRHAEVIGELRGVVADQPFRENSCALLMLALYRCGSQGEAIAVYQAARRILIDELGCEPGPALRRMYEQILRGDPSLAALESAAAAGGPVPVVPRGLPGAIMAALATELADAAGRLDVLDAENPASGMRAAFSWSCRGLSAAAARLFGLLGFHPGPDISAAAAASLAGLPGPARAALSELTQAGLIAQHVPGRFAMHDLVRLYAAEQSEANGAASLRHGQHALGLYRSGRDQQGEAAALNAIGWCHALLTQYEQADTLGYVHHHLGEYASAEACYRSAIALFRDLGIVYSTADTLSHLGDTYRETGDIEAARNTWQQSLTILRDLDHVGAADVQAKLTGQPVIDGRGT
ncbi:MAG TPA: BTAD domain-containing putative transcriptional regulator [Streptosporangiaceae bacterium]|nr:BTAD domain-containing putative transcriptional regulator [Streptosporangiaceae bacterium]